jgi:putative oxidoreductase
MARLLPSWAFDARGPRAAFLLRVVTGAILVSEGLQKFLFASELGAGRFAKIGIPMPEVMGPFVGVVEIAGGLLMIACLVFLLAVGGGPWSLDGQRGGASGRGGRG